MADNLTKRVGGKIAKSGWIEFALMVLLIFASRSVFADWNHVPTGSMKPTILEGDLIFVNRMAYDLKFPFTRFHLLTFGAPARGDVIVVQSPYDDSRLVKRVVGVPGDLIEVRGQTLILNGKPLQYQAATRDLGAGLNDEDRRNHTLVEEKLPGQTHSVMFGFNAQRPKFRGPMVIPEDKYFLMGDHRNNSFDSRYFGLVDREMVLGHAIGVIGSADATSYYSPRWERFFTALD